MRRTVSVDISSLDVQSVSTYDMPSSSTVHLHSSTSVVDLPFYKKPCFQTYKALFLVLISTLFLSINSVIIKYISYMTASELAFTRYAAMFVFNMPFLVMSRSKHLLNKSTFPTLCARGVFGCVSLYLSYLGMKLMPIAESSVIVSTAPVWVALLSKLILKENFGWLNTASLVFTMIGLVLMSRVFVFAFGTSEERYHDMNYWYGCIASLGSAILGALTIVFIRKVKGVEASVTIAYQAMAGVIIMPLIELKNGKVNIPECGRDSALLVVLGIFSFLGQTLLTSALRLEKAGAVSCVRFSSRVILLFLFQVLFFQEIPDAYSIAAAVAVTVSLWISVLKKYLKYKQDQAIKNQETESNVQEPEIESTVREEQTESNEEEKGELESMVQEEETEANEAETEYLSQDRERTKL